MGKSFSDTVGRMPDARVRRLSIAEAEAILVARGISVDEVAKAAGRKSKGKYAGEIDAGLWVCDITHGGWSRPHEVGYRSGNFVGSRGVCRPGRRYILTGGWCGSIMAAWVDNADGWLDVYEDTAGGPIALALERCCKFGAPFSGKAYPFVATMVDYKAKRRLAATCDATVNGAHEDLNEAKACLAGSGYLRGYLDDHAEAAWEWMPTPPLSDSDRAAVEAEMATLCAKYPNLAESMARTAAKVKDARHALIRWTGFAA